MEWNEKTKKKFFQPKLKWHEEASLPLREKSNQTIMTSHIK